MTNPEITVVIPTRDRSRLLRTHGLRAALLQEDVNLEVLVVNDGSRDDTAAELQDIRDERVRTIHHEVPQGQAQARNHGLQAARGPWVAFLDDDDLWSPQKLRAQLDSVKSTEAAFAYSGAVVLDEHLNLTAVLDPPASNGLATELLRRNVIPAGASNILASTSALRSLGGFDESLSHLTDWDMWIRLALAYSACASSEALVAYFLHRENLLVRDSEHVVSEAIYLAAKHRAAARPKRGIDTAWVAEWLAWTRRRLGDRRAASRALLRAAVQLRSPKLLYRGVREELVRHRPPNRQSKPLASEHRSSTPALDGAFDWVNLYRQAVK